MSIAPTTAASFDLPALEHRTGPTIDLRRGAGAVAVDSLVLVDLIAEEEALAFSAGAGTLGRDEAARLLAVSGEIDARWETFLSR